MPIFSSIDQILSFAPTAFQAQPAFPDSSMALPPPAPDRRWRVALGVAVGAVVLILLLSHATPVAPGNELALLRDLAGQGNAGAQLQLGLAYRDGRYGLERDTASALAWMTRAANGGQSYAADLVGTAYAQGNGTERDMDAARHWWAIAAKGGNADAARRLGESLAITDSATADRWLEDAARQGDQQAERDLRQLYADHAAPASDLALGTQPVEVIAHQLGSPGLRSLADTWALLTHGAAFTQSREALLHHARADDPVAEFQLGMRYRDGSWAVNRDPARAELWLQRAADNGNSLARQALDEPHKD